MASLVRGLAELIDDGEDQPQFLSVAKSKPKTMKSITSPTETLPTPPALLNGDNQKLIAFTNNTNLNFNGDGNGVLKLPGL